MDRRGGPIAWPPRSTPDLNHLGFYLWGHLNTLVYAAPVDNEETVALWMPVRLSATAPTSLNGYGGPWWDVSRRVLNLMEDILITYHKCALSAVTHKLMFPDTRWYGHFFLFWYVKLVSKNLSAPFSYTLYNCTNYSLLPVIQIPAQLPVHTTSGPVDLWSPNFFK
jgi:hypothetical protein